MRLAMMATQSTGGPETWTKSRPQHETGEVMKDGPARILIMARSPKSSTQRPDTCVQNCVLIARRQLADAARLLDLTVHDHLIVGNGTGAWVSLAERGQV